MKSAMEPLPEDVETLKALLLFERQSAALNAAQKDQEIERLKQNYQQLLEQFRIARHRQFGQSSEANVDQLGLFNEAEAELEDELVEDTIPDAEPPSRKNRPKRKPLPRDLPRERVVHDLDEADKICSCCGHDLHGIGEETREQLEFIPAQVKVIEHIRLKYACRHCEQQGIETPIKTAPVPATPIPKSIATPSLLAQIISGKYQYALPLYRQEALFAQYGIDLNRKTMAEWMIKSSLLLAPLVQRLKTILLQQAVIQADETPLKVIHEDKKKCYMWVYCSGADSPDGRSDLANIVLYDYQNSRAGQCPVDYLGDYQGYLQVDGYIGYEQTQASLAGCLAHARRKFVEAKQAQPKGKAGRANWALAQIQKLYRIESGINGKSAEEKQAIRQAQSEPLLTELKDWLERSALQVPPKSAIGKAIAYSLNQWPKLIRYLEDGRLGIDNNRAERAIKPFVIGRKNWLFANTARGATASAILYSLIETARANGLVAFDYLQYLLEELPKKPECIEHLLPWNVKLDKS